MHIYNVLWETFEWNGSKYQEGHLERKCTFLLHQEHYKGNEVLS